MKLRYTIFPLLIGLFWVMMGQETAVRAQNPNLLTNPGFDNGHHHQDSIAEIVVPDGWVLHWLNGVPFEGTFENPTARPESVVWFIGDAPANERSLYFKNGSYALKIFKSWAPVWIGLSQDVNGLQIGKTYRFVVPIYIDVFSDYQGGVKIPPPPEHAQATKIRLGASPVGAAWLDGNAIAYSRWWTGADTSPFYLAYPVFTYEFVATQTSMTVWVEMVSSYPAFPNHGFFLDALELYQVGGSSSISAPAVAGVSQGEPPTPAATPRADGAIIHVVQPGDSLWTIAIQYATTLGLPADQALAAIQELNNNPTFINPGDEIIIVPPSAVTATPEVTAESVITATTTLTETAVTVEVATAAATTTPTPTGICVAAFNDINGDGRHDTSETYLGDAVFNLLQGGSAVATYISTGLNEPYCFNTLAPDTYQIQFSPPPNYRPTTTDSWALALEAGKQETIAFGAQPGVETAVAENMEDIAQPTATLASTLTTPTTQEGGIFSNIGTIVLGVAVVLVLLAVVGVILLRRA